MAKKATVQHWCNVARNGRSWRKALWNGRQLEGCGKRSYNMTVLRIAGSILVFKAGVNPRTTASSAGIAQVSGVSVGKWKRKAKRGDSEGRETPFVSLFPPSSSPPPPPSFLQNLLSPNHQRRPDTWRTYQRSEGARAVLNQELEGRNLKSLKRSQAVAKGTRKEADGGNSEYIPWQNETFFSALLRQFLKKWTFFSGKAFKSSAFISTILTWPVVPIFNTFFLIKNLLSTVWYKNWYRDVL